MLSKPFYRSKTLWFNALTILVAFAAHFGWTPDPTLTNTVSIVLVSINPLVNLVLRLFTRHPIAPILPSIPTY
jgi:hypothetical protein